MKKKSKLFIFIFERVSSSFCLHITLCRYIHIFLCSVTELPAKAPVYGTLFGLLNVTSHELVGKLMYEVNDLLKQGVAESDWFRLKQLLRFYGELVNANVILPTSYCNLVSTFLSALDESDRQRVSVSLFTYLFISV